MSSQIILISYYKMSNNALELTGRQKMGKVEKKKKENLSGRLHIFSTDMQYSLVSTSYVPTTF